MAHPVGTGITHALVNVHLAQAALEALEAVADSYILAFVVETQFAFPVQFTIEER